MVGKRTVRDRMIVRGGVILGRAYNLCRREWKRPPVLEPGRGSCFFRAVSFLWLMPAGKGFLSGRAYDEGIMLEDNGAVAPLPESVGR